MAVPKIKNRVNFADVFLGNFVPGFRQGRQEAIRANELAREQANTDRVFQARQQAQQFRQRLAEEQAQRAAELHPLDLEKGRLGVEEGKFKLDASKEDREYDLSARLPAEDLTKRRDELYGLDVQGKKSNLLTAAMGRKLTAAQIAKANREGIPHPVTSLNQTGEGRFTYEELSQKKGEVARALEDEIKRQSVGGKEPGWAPLARKDLQAAIKTSAISNKMRSEFDKVTKTLGKDRGWTIIGGIPVLGRSVDVAQLSHQQVKSLNAYLSQLGTALQDSEQNNKQAQDEIRNGLYRINKLDTAEMIKQKRDFIVSLLESREGASGTYLEATGILKPRALPATGPQGSVPVGRTPASSGGSNLGRTLVSSGSGNVVTSSGNVRFNYAGSNK